MKETNTASTLSSAAPTSMFLHLRQNQNQYVYSVHTQTPQLLTLPVL